MDEISLLNSASSGGFNGSTVGSVDDVNSIGSGNFAFQINFALDQYTGDYDPIFQMTSTGGKRNFIDVRVNHRFDLLSSEIGWIDNGIHRGTYVNIPLSELPNFNDGVTRSLIFQRTNLDNGNALFETILDGSIIGSTETELLPSFQSFDFVGTGKVTNWASGLSEFTSLGTFSDLLYGTPVEAAENTDVAGPVTNDDVFLVTDSGLLYTWDGVSSLPSMIGDTGISGLRDIAIAPDGQLYAISSSALYRVDAQSADAQLVGSLTGFLYPGVTAISDAQGFDIDVNGVGRVASGNNSIVAVLDLETGGITNSTGNILGFTSSAGDIWFKDEGGYFVSSTSSTLIEIGQTFSGAEYSAGSDFISNNAIQGLVSLAGPGEDDRAQLIGFSGKRVFNLSEGKFALPGLETNTLSLNGNIVGAARIKEPPTVQSNPPTLNLAPEISVATGTQMILDITATDDADSEGDGLTYELLASADSNLFSLNSQTGEIFYRFGGIPAASDLNADGSYELRVSVSDKSGNTVAKSININTQNGPTVLPEVTGNLVLSTLELADTAYPLQWASEGTWGNDLAWVLPEEWMAYGIDGQYRNSVDAPTSYFPGSVETHVSTFAGIVDGERTLAIAFSGTNPQNKDDFIRQIGDWDTLLDQHANFLSQVMARAKSDGIQNLLVVGHSMGGILTEEFLAQAGEMALPEDQTSYQDLIGETGRLYGVTFGSPGSGRDVSEQLSAQVSLINFANFGDPVAALSKEGAFFDLVNEDDPGSLQLVAANLSLMSDVSSGDTEGIVSNAVKDNAGRLFSTSMSREGTTIHIIPERQGLEQINFPEWIYRHALTGNEHSYSRYVNDLIENWGQSNASGFASLDAWNEGGTGWYRSWDFRVDEGLLYVVYDIKNVTTYLADMGIAAAFEFLPGLPQIKSAVSLAAIAEGAIETTTELTTEVILNFAEDISLVYSDPTSQEAQIYLLSAAGRLAFPSALSLPPQAWASLANWSVDQWEVAIENWDSLEPDLAGIPAASWKLLPLWSPFLIGTLAKQGFDAALSLFSSPPQKSDVDGNGIEDVIFFNEATRTIGQYSMPEGIWSSIGFAGEGWEAIGKGDFDADGSGDILWLNAAIQKLGRFDMESGQSTWKGIGGFSGPWDVSGTGDFDGDGDDDVLWTNTITNSAGQFRMEDGAPTWLNLGPTGVNWSVVGVGDFNKDDVEDVLWQNSETGVLGQFRMAHNDKAWLTVATIGIGWDVAGIGDTNADGFDDILVFNEGTRKLGLIDMYEGTASWSGIVGTAGDNWDVVDIADLNGDFRDDIVWRNSETNEMGQFRMGGLNPEWLELPQAGADWVLV